MIPFPPDVFGLQNAIILDKINIYQGLPQGNSSDEALRMSALGTPVYSDLTLEGGTYTNEAGQEFNFGSIYFDTVIMIVDQQKRIIKTSVQGRDGDVKEYIGMGDYTVTINAILAFDNGRYDRDAVAEVKKMLTAPVSIKCISWFLQLWDIDEIVIEGYGVPQQAGQYSMQPFSINAVSNKPIELIQF